MPDEPKWLGVRVHIPDETLRAHLDAIGLALVDRRGVTPESDSEASLMKSEDVLSVLEPGQNLTFSATQDTRNFLTVGAPSLGASAVVPLSAPSHAPISDTQCVRVRAIWRSWGEIEVPGMSVNANVFGGVGALMPEQTSLRIPAVRADAPEARDALAYYGATLIPSGSTVSMGNEIPLYGVAYRFSPAYTREFVFQAEGANGQRGGGGLFVETHPFPHLFAPMEPSCGGALILGRRRGSGEFDFTAFQIPYGAALHVASNVIHGDSFFTGKYGIVLTDAAADTVLFRKPGDGKVAGAVYPVELGWRAARP